MTRWKLPVFLKLEFFISGLMFVVCVWEGKREICFGIWANSTPILSGILKLQNIWNDVLYLLKILKPWPWQPFTTQSNNILYILNRQIKFEMSTSNVVFIFFYHNTLTQFHELSAPNWPTTAKRTNLNSSTKYLRC